MRSFYSQFLNKMLKLMKFEKKCKNFYGILAFSILISRGFCETKVLQTYFFIKTLFLMKINDRYINPLTDYGFKLLFGTEENKDLLLHFMNQLLPTNFKIKSLTYTSTERLGDTAEDRKAIFDVYGIGKEGEHYTLEMQNASHKFIKERIVYYSAITIRQQAKKGDWDFDLPPIFTICIMNFRFKDEVLRQKKRVVHEIYLRDPEGYIFFDKLVYFYVELPNFKKNKNEVRTLLDKWLFLLRNLSRLEAPPEGFVEPIFLKVLEIAEIANLSSKEYEKYLKSMERYNVYQLTLDEKIEEGIKLGQLQSQLAINKAKKLVDKAIKRAEKAKYQADLERVEKLKALHQARQERLAKQKIVEEKRRIEAENKRVEAEKRRIEGENQRVEGENQRVEEEKQHAIKSLRTRGMSDEEIAIIYNVTVEEVRKIV